MANAANITRRSIFKLAPAAVLATGGAIVAFPAKSEPLTLDQEIEASIKHLDALLSKKYPRAIPVESFKARTVVTTRYGGYMLMFMSEPPKIAWSGEGYYEVFPKLMDDKPTLMWVEQRLDKSQQPDGYRAYVREHDKQISDNHYFSDRTLNIFKKI